MQKGPQGQLRPSSPTSCAILVMKIATGQVDETAKRPKKVKQPFQTDANLDK